MQYAINRLMLTKEREVVRMMLKFSRERGMDAVFDALAGERIVDLEHTLLTQLHKSVVVEGEFAVAERLIAECQPGTFENYISHRPYTPKWTKLDVTDSNGDKPCMRGGHQMCIDSE